MLDQDMIDGFQKRMLLLFGQVEAIAHPLMQIRARLGL
jgi:hypothetical protein